MVDGYIQGGLATDRSTRKLWMYTENIEIGTCVYVSHARTHVCVLELVSVRAWGDVCFASVVGRR